MNEMNQSEDRWKMFPEFFVHFVPGKVCFHLFLSTMAQCIHGVLVLYGIVGSKPHEMFRVVIFDDEMLQLLLQI